MIVQTPASRKTDPETSFLAEDEINRTGKRQRQQKEVRDAVTLNPGRTSAELAQCCVLDRWQIARRLPEVEVAGRVRRGGSRRCRVTGRKSITWWAV